jgi:hypothetical protein
MIDLTEIEQTIKKEVEKKINQELSQVDIGDLLATSLVNMAQDKVNTTVTSMVNGMLRQGTLQQLIEDKIGSELQTKLDEAILARVSGMVSRIDLGTQISEKIEQFVITKMKTLSLPDSIIPINAVNTTAFTISADKITKGLYKDFASTGIEDVAKGVELTVMDGSVIVENNLISNQLSIEDAAEFKGNVNVAGDLRVVGNLVMLNPAFNKQITSIVNDRIAEHNKDSVVDITGSAVYASDKEILTENALGPSVLTSNLRKVGNLTELSVRNNFTVGETLYVADGRIGINTEEPAGALTVWDEEAELTMRKHKSKTTYLGTTRDCDLVLGINGNIVMSLRKEGIEVESINVGGIKMSVANMVPEREGTPGEIVIMQRAVSGQPWAYQCVEGRSWAALSR